MGRLTESRLNACSESWTWKGEDVSLRAVCEDDPEVPNTPRKNFVNGASGAPPAGEKSSPFRSLFTVDFSQSPVYIKDKQTSDTVKADNYRAAGVSELGFLPTVSHTGP